MAKSGMHYTNGLTPAIVYTTTHGAYGMKPGASHVITLRPCQSPTISNNNNQKSLTTTLTNCVINKVLPIYYVHGTNYIWLNYRIMLGKMHIKNRPRLIRQSLSQVLLLLLYSQEILCEIQDMVMLYLQVVNIALDFEKNTVCALGGIVVYV